MRWCSFHYFACSHLLSILMGLGTTYRARNDQPNKPRTQQQEPSGILLSKQDIDRDKARVRKHRSRQQRSEQRSAIAASEHRPNDGADPRRNHDEDHRRSVGEAASANRSQSSTRRQQARRRSRTIHTNDSAPNEQPNEQLGTRVWIE